MTMMMMMTMTMKIMIMISIIIIVITMIMILIITILMIMMQQNLVSIAQYGNIFHPSYIDWYGLVVDEKSSTDCDKHRCKYIHVIVYEQM